MPNTTNRETKKKNDSLDEDGTAIMGTKQQNQQICVYFYLNFLTFDNFPVIEHTIIWISGDILYFYCSIFFYLYMFCILMFVTILSQTFMRIK